MNSPVYILTAINNTAVNALDAPESVLSWHYLYAQSMQLLHATAQILPTLLLGFILLTISYFVASPLSKLLVKPLVYMTDSKLVHLVARRGISILILLLGVYLFLRLAGLTEFAIAIMSGTGLIGLILGFAFRDIAENFIASLLLSVQRPFKIDDVIEVDNRLGVVKKVTARATTLVDYDGNHIQIPNSTVYKNTIKNLTANPKMRAKVVIGIGYDNDIRYCQTLGLEIANKQTGVINEPPAQVLINNLGSSTINFNLFFWVNSEQHSPLKVASQLMRELVTEFTMQNISMPDDARERIILSTPDESDTQKPTSKAEQPLAAQQVTKPLQQKMKRLMM
ncbi:mechanosensitive ion channel family protein [Pseudoalteromonas espejiana]